jgi:hypothetical protein
MAITSRHFPPRWTIIEHAGSFWVQNASGLRQPRWTPENDLAVRRALKTAGVEFIDENGGGPGSEAPQVRSSQGKRVGDGALARQVHARIGADLRGRWWSLPIGRR